MRTARFIGSWITGLTALAMATLLLVQWFRFVLSAAGDLVPTPLFLWLALGVNLMAWSALGLVRLGDDAFRGSHRYRGVVSGDRAPTEAVEREREPAGVGASSETEKAARAPLGVGTEPDRTAPVAPSSADTASPADTAASTSLAVIIPAHNEEPVIAGAITSALRLFPRRDVYVVSDSSGDSTAAIAAGTGVNVLDLLTNHGKAGAIEATIAEFGLTEAYDGVVILDADTELDAGYVRGVREQFRDPTVAAVAGFVVAEWKPRERTVLGRIISAYRDRLYFMLQYLMRFAQTWRHTSVTFIVPGFASAYRSSALRNIDINPKGLVIEDFNMTFEVHRKRLGRISMHPGTRAYCQDPFTIGDYIRQVRRWTLGFWQTVRRHGVWPSLFWLALACYIVEVLAVSLLLLGMTVLGVLVFLPELTDGAILTLDWYATGHSVATGFLPLSVIAVGLFVPDYALSCVMAAIRRRPGYLVYGLFFLPLRILDSFLTLRTLPQAWTQTSDGRWRSPGREAGPL